MTATDAEGSEQEYGYDRLGRMTWRKDGLPGSGRGGTLNSML